MIKKIFIKAMILSFCILTILGMSLFASARDFKWPRLIKIATPGTQSGGFASTNGWGAKFGNALDLQLRVVPVDSEVRRYVRFTAGREFDLNSVTVADSTYAIQGEVGYADKRAYPFRAVWHQSDTPWSIVVRGNSKFKTIYDLKQKGVRVALAIGQPAMVTAVKEVLPAFIGWTKEEAEKNWIFVPVSSYAENCRSVTEGKADAAWGATISSVFNEMEAHPAKIRWLDMPLADKDSWQRMLKASPTVIPAKIDLGVPSSIGVEALTSNFIYWSRADADQEMVYQIARWLHQHFDDYKDTHPLNKRMELKYFRNYLNHACLPVAEGTVRYLKEIGQWSAKDEKWNNAAIALMDRWVSARNAALDEAKAKGVDIHWEDKEYLAILKKHTKDIPVFTSRLD
jgi:hypothetical protein